MRRRPASKVDRPRDHPGTGIDRQTRRQPDRRPGQRVQIGIRTRPLPARPHRPRRRSDRPDRSPAAPGWCRSTVQVNPTSVNSTGAPSSVARTVTAYDPAAAKRDRPRDHSARRIDRQPTRQPGRRPRQRVQIRIRPDHRKRDHVALGVRLIARIDHDWSAGSCRSHPR